MIFICEELYLFQAINCLNDVAQPPVQQIRHLKGEHP
jgi:hypothetical protein